MNNADNSTAHLSTEYDSKINSTIPYYSNFHLETINFIKVINNNPKIWLDTGCGTGSLVEKAAEYFKNTKFILSDPSEEMLNKAKNKLTSIDKNRFEFLQPVSTEDIDLTGMESPDIITAIQSHHYLSVDERLKATQKCYDILNKGGAYITFENIRPLTSEGVEIGKKYWQEFQIKAGKPSEEAEKHIRRFGIEYFPITIEEHLNLLKSSGFKVVELFWYSYLQAGFYCIK